MKFVNIVARKQMNPKMIRKKVVLIGNANCGKSKAVNELLGHKHDYPIIPTTNGQEQSSLTLGDIMGARLGKSTRYIPTLGVDVSMYKGISAIYNIWDTSGNPAFKGLGIGYYVNADIIIICGGENKSFDSNRTLDQLYTMASNACPNALIICIANITDDLLRNILI